MNNLSWNEYIENARKNLLSGEIYQDMVDKGLITECPTTVTDSTMDAIYYRLIGDIEASETAYENAKNHHSQWGNAELRAEWLRNTLDAL